MQHSNDITNTLPCFPAPSAAQVWLSYSDSALILNSFAITNFPLLTRSIHHCNQREEGGVRRVGARVINSTECGGQKDMRVLPLHCIDLCSPHFLKAHGVLKVPTSLSSWCTACCACFHSFTVDCFYRGKGGYVGGLVSMIMSVHPFRIHYRWSAISPYQQPESWPIQYWGIVRSLLLLLFY